MADTKFNPVKRDSRTCFGISWFATEEEADEYAKSVREQGITYNGGFMHGLPCGRDTAFDYVDTEHGRLFAVTD